MNKPRKVILTALALSVIQLNGCDGNKQAGQAEGPSSKKFSAFLLIAVLFTTLMAGCGQVNTVIAIGNPPLLLLS